MLYLILVVSPEPIVNFIESLKMCLTKNQMFSFLSRETLDCSRCPLDRVVFFMGVGSCPTDALIIVVLVLLYQFQNLLIPVEYLLDGSQSPLLRLASGILLLGLLLRLSPTLGQDLKTFIFEFVMLH